ncbi:hypothetical protein [Kitasatospora sp. NPDC059827]|uniref:hypothetical protein n=1 Tax=Kitasatospora sp. NPDC059827 TaxID=3346964 RepID=UPI0036499E96
MYKGTFLDTGLPGLTLTTCGLPYAVVTKHPLHMCEEEVSNELRPALDSALSFTQDAGRVVVTDWFTLEKSPMQVVELLQAR